MKTLSLDFGSSVVPEMSDPTPHVSRGQILSGVLSGTCSYESIPVLTDAPVSSNEPDIDYDPANDQRIDRFDAVEMGIEEIDSKTPEPRPDSSAVEKNE